MRTHVFGRMIVAALVLAACGGGDDADPVDDSPPPETAPADEPAADGDESAPEPAAEPVPTTTTASAPDAFVSDDGRLAVTAPGDGTAVTIDATDDAAVPSTDGDVFVAGYDLGPDAVSFDPPLRVFFEMADADVERGVLIVHTTSDGSSEPLATERVDGGLAFELESFSWIDVFTLSDDAAIQLPTTAQESQTFPPLLSGYGVDEVALDVNDGEWTTTEPVEIVGTEFACATVGDGTISIDGTVKLPVFDNTLGLFPYTHRYVQIDHDVGCTGLFLSVQPSGGNCFDLETFGFAEGCPPSEEIDLRVSAAPDGWAFRFRPPAASQTVFSFQVQVDDELRYFEADTNGRFSGQYGDALVPYVPTVPDGLSGFEDPFDDQLSEEIGTLPIELVFPEGSPVAKFTVPGGTDENGNQVLQTVGDLLNLTLYVDGDGRRSVYSFDVEELVASLRARYGD